MTAAVATGHSQGAPSASQNPLTAGLERLPVAPTALGPLASAETRQTINRAESRPQALALLFMAPEFQRR